MSNALYHLQGCADLTAPVGCGGAIADRSQWLRTLAAAPCSMVSHWRTSSESSLCPATFSSLVIPRQRVGAGPRAPCPDRPSLPSPAANISSPSPPRVLLAGIPSIIHLRPRFHSLSLLLPLPSSSPIPLFTPVCSSLTTRPRPVHEVDASNIAEVLDTHTRCARHLSQRYATTTSDTQGPAPASVLAAARFFPAPQPIRLT